MANKTLIMTGFARTGTYGAVKFNELFGIRSFHQRLCPPGYLRLMWYNFKEPPNVVKEYVKTAIEGLSGFGEHHFEASWDFGNFIYQMQKSRPELDFIISLRDPLYSCSSLLHYGHWKEGKNTKYSVVAKCSTHHIRILEQVKLMEKKPFWMDFQKYVDGGYIKGFFKYFGIRRSKENIEKAKEFLKQKLNHRGDYRLISLEHNHYIYKVIQEIKNECPEFS